jgi:large subunit ribosomal protein L1
MAAVAKRTKTWKEKLPPGKSYSIDEALKLVKEFATAKFNESVDVSVNLGVDATKSDQQVRGSTVMPHGTGKTVRVAVFTQGKNAETWPRRSRPAKLISTWSSPARMPCASSANWARS